MVPLAQLVGPQTMNLLSFTDCDSWVCVLPGLSVHKFWVAMRVEIVQYMSSRMSRAAICAARNPVCSKEVDNGVIWCHWVQ